MIFSFRVAQCEGVNECFRKELEKTVWKVEGARHSCRTLFYLLFYSLITFFYQNVATVTLKSWCRQRMCCTKCSALSTKAYSESRLASVQGSGPPTLPATSFFINDFHRGMELFSYSTQEEGSTDSTHIAALILLAVSSTIKHTGSELHTQSCIMVQ